MLLFLFDNHLSHYIFFSVNSLIKFASFTRYFDKISVFPETLDEIFICSLAHQINSCFPQPFDVFCIFSNPLTKFAFYFNYKLILYAIKCVLWMKLRYSAIVWRNSHFSWSSDEIYVFSSILWINQKSFEKIRIFSQHFDEIPVSRSFLTNFGFLSNLLWPQYFKEHNEIMRYQKFPK